jgi:shikimate kinase
LVDRLTKEKGDRPLIASLEDNKISEFVAKHLFERRVFYEKANFIIKTEGKSKSEIIKELNVSLQ